MISHDNYTRDVPSVTHLSVRIRRDSNLEEDVTSRVSLTLTVSLLLHFCKKVCYYNFTGIYREWTTRVIIPCLLKAIHYSRHS